MNTPVPTREEVERLRANLDSKTKESEGWEAERDRYRAECIELHVKLEQQVLQIDEARRFEKHLESQISERDKIITDLRMDVSVKIGENVAQSEELNEQVRLNRAFEEAKAKDLEALMDLLETLTPFYFHAKALRSENILNIAPLKEISKCGSSALVGGAFSSVIEAFEKWGEIAGVFTEGRELDKRTYSEALRDGKVIEKRICEKCAEAGKPGHVESGYEGCH